MTLTVIGIAGTPDVLEALLAGCAETKNPKIVQMSVSCLHRLIAAGAISQVNRMHVDDPWT